MRAVASASSRYGRTRLLVVRKGHPNTGVSWWDILVRRERLVQKGKARAEVYASIDVARRYHEILEAAGG